MVVSHICQVFVDLSKQFSFAGKDDDFGLLIISGYKQFMMTDISSYRIDMRKLCMQKTEDQNSYSLLDQEPISQAFFEMIVECLHSSLQYNNKTILSNYFIITRTMRRIIISSIVFCMMSISLVNATGQQTTTPNSNEVGIDCPPDQLRNGQCTFSIYRTLGIKQDTNQDPTSVGLFVQDIILSLTFFIGTVLTISLIYAGILFIRSGVTGDEEKQSTAKK